MTWARLDDSFPDNLKVSALSDKAFRVHVTAICYSARALSDGHVPSSWRARLELSPKVARELLDSGVWEDAADGYRIHDYLEYNPSRERVTSKREARADAGRAGGLASRTAKQGGKPRANAVANASANAVANEPANATAFAVPVRRTPVPSRPQEDSLRSSSSADEPPQAVRERRDMILMALPRKYQADSATFDEAELVAEDLTTEQISDGIAACRRAQQLPFPRNIRAQIDPPKAAAAAGKTLPYDPGMSARALLGRAK